MGWTADAPVTAQHEVKALREMVGSSYNGRLNLARSQLDVEPWTRKSVRRAVVRPLEALLDPLALVADGLDDDWHFCTHFGSSFLWGER